MSVLRALFAVLLMTACTPQVPIDPRAILNRAQIDASPQPILLADAARLNGGATLVEMGRRDGVVTWRTRDFAALSYRDGLLVATRGLGFDLMSADVSGSRAALSGGPAQGYTRLASFLGPEDDTVFRAFVCEMRNAGSDSVQSFGLTFPALRMEETCYGKNLRIDNRYWVAPGGGLRRSIQWVSPEVGYLETEQISRDIVE